MVSVGFINGGQTHDVIPETVKLGGTFRSLTTEGLAYIKERIKEVKRSLFDLYNFLSLPLK